VTEVYRERMLRVENKQPDGKNTKTEKDVASTYLERRK
jgi:hypothetical protein